MSSWRHRIVWTAAMMLLALAAEAQMWKGTGRASGVVRDPDGEPIQGAEVTLRWGRDPEAGPAPVLTRKKGGWSVLGLAPGRWSLLIEAEGFRQSQGTIEVRQGVTPPVEVMLRPLAIQTPTISEGRLESLRTWIETGNSLLERGEWEAARAEYAKVLSELEGRGRAEVLRSVARTHYMEGSVDEAVATLQAAVLAGPDDETTRAVYRSLMEIEGRTTEGESFLAGVDDGSLRPEPESGAARSGEDEPALRSEIGGSPVEPLPLNAVPGKLGAYATAFDRHHDLASIETFAERFGRSMAHIERADPAAGRYDLAGESFQVFVPKSYEADGTWGLFVWVSPTGRGRVPTPGAEAALRENKLIWVAADRSGNERLTWNRIGLALDAAENARRYYEVDPGRVYVGGYSGGGRIATALALLYPEVFRGGLFVYGVDFYRRVAVPDRPGSDWLPWFPPPGKASLSELRDSTRLVLVTGERDFNRLQTEVFAERYRDEGFQRVTYIEIPGAGHYDWPPRKWLSEAMAALDQAQHP